MLWDPEILASVRACLLVFFRVFSWCCFQLFRRRSRGNLWKRSNWSLVGTAKGVIFTLSFIVRTTLRLPVRLVKHKMLSCEENKYIECCAINCDCSPAHLHWTDRLGNDGADIFEVHWAPGPEFWFRVSIWFSFSLPISILFSLFLFLCQSLLVFFSCSCSLSNDVSSYHSHVNVLLHVRAYMTDSSYIHKEYKHIYE